MAPGLRRKFCNKQRHYRGTKDRHKDNEGDPRTWRRCLSVTYPFRYAPSYRQSGSDRLAGGPF